MRPLCVLRSGMELGDWLRSLGLERYEAVFRENAIDPDVICDLTEEHLRELGVPLGDRLKLLKAIAALASGKEPSGPTEGTQPVDVKAEAVERRHVTVMFSDLVGSTALSASMDPEDLREIISAYQKCVAEIVRRFGGFVAKYMGDGVLVYFGYPQAHEDDAERAVRAGLELIAGVSALQSRTAVQTRIGIATGLVIVGDLIGSGDAQERGIVGETPNLAARLQSIAEPNMVVLGESTRSLLGDIFELEDLGKKNLKGIARPVRVFSALRASSIASRFEALHATDLPPLIGRDEELELLLRRWSKAKGGEGQVVLLSGEAGIGKSRLSAALLERLATEQHTRLRYFCSPQHTDSALQPIIGQMERAAGLAHDDTTQVRLDKLDAFLAQTSTPKEDVLLFAEMLSLPNDGRYSKRDLIPQQRWQKTQEALTTQLEKLTSQQPVLMIFEDVHWIDPTSLEMLNRTVDRIKNLPALLIVTFRPEFNAPWIGQSRVTSLVLNRLEEHEAASIVARLARSNELSSDVTTQIVERTDGIPLFVEEMTRAVLDTKGEISSAAVSVPASLHGSLMARLDRLGSAKEVAQIGAAIGREFSDALLREVVRKPDAELELALEHLIAASLLLRQGVPPHWTYLFKHALVQDAAYGSLLREPRRKLHARIAETLENQFADMVQSQPELLAQHCSQAGWPEKAAFYWRTAGERAALRGANVEAIEHFRRALLRNAERSENTDRLRTELAILSQLGPALMSIQGWAAPAVGEVLERATNVARQLEASRDLAAPLTSLWLFRYARGELDQSDEISHELFRIARKLNDGEVTLQAHHAAGPMRWVRGSYLEAAKHFESCLSLYHEEDHAQHRYCYMGHDPAVCAMTVGASVKWALGYPAQATVGAEGVGACAQTATRTLFGARAFFQCPISDPATRCCCCGCKRAGTAADLPGIQAGSTRGAGVGRLGLGAGPGRRDKGWVRTA